jgi:ubiquinone/menaquinone biosynthesis C-methylase UbiE
MELALSALASRPLGPALYTLKQRSVAAFLGAAAGLWHSALSPHERKGDKRLLRVIDELHQAALRADYAQAEEGLYPKSLIYPLPGWHDVRFLPEALLDAPRLLRRKRRGDFVVHADDAQGTSALPDYYLRTFHWQTDGWMSAHSARIYELQVEFLFFGTMDVMRRRALAALVRSLRAKESPSILDVACGTGRLLEQASVALPEARLEGVDLSPYYVERASRRLRPGRDRVRVGNAEDLGGPDDTFDAVTCGFLFHEMPRDARRRVAHELFRVLTPGGLAVVQDSMQRMDDNGHALEAFLEWFPSAYHEPYFKGYIDDDLAMVLEDAGFQVQLSDTVLFSKVVVARKPMSGAAHAPRPQS